MTRRYGALAAVALGVGSLGASPFIPWEDLTESDWLYSVATRFSTVEGHRVHYPTPTVELVAALQERSEPAAKRQLAEARLALGDRAGAFAAIEQWAVAEGPEAWAEAARFGADHADMPFAFRAAAKAVPELGGEEQRTLLDQQITWADGHPEAGDPIALRKLKTELRPDDAAAAEDFIRALENAGRLDEADAALLAARGLGEERQLLLRSDLQAAHGNRQRAYERLDEGLAAPGSAAWSPETREAFARRLDEWNKTLPETWRASLEKAYEPRALLRLATYFQGAGRGGSAADLLRQVERRYESGFGRSQFLLQSRLASEIDAVPEAFRARLAAAKTGSPADQANDLAALGELALRAGGRPLGWGTYNDEPYRWIARVDRTPGFWTGGLSFLLTGQDWAEALARLETESLPDRTFATARALVDELARRVPEHPELPALRAKVMARHVERGEGREALALLPLLEKGPPAVAAQARRTALLAARLTPMALGEEVRLYKARLAALAPDGSRPSLDSFSYDDSLKGPGSRRSFRTPDPTAERYRDVLDEAIARLDQRDASHGTSVELMLAEMDRLPEAEALWLELAARLEGWNLDDDLGPRYEQALTRFRGEDVWSRAVRWYGRRARSRDLDRLAGELARRFRGAPIFARLGGAGAVTLDVPTQPPAGTRVRLVAWADWVRLRALERFPHSPLVFREAQGHLVARGVWAQSQAQGHLVARGVWAQSPRRSDQGKVQPVIVEDALFDERRAALLFIDKDRRDEYLGQAMSEGRLESLLEGLEKASPRSPVEDRLLFDGWSRLSRFERAAPAADRLAAAYPGDGLLAGRVLSLHRSLGALEPGHVAAAQKLVERTTPALVDPNPLFTELGELQLESGHPEVARATWKRLIERDPRSPERILELATLLWDYGQMKEALAVIEEGRARVGRPHLHAFEAGVLREEGRDLEGAVREYLDAALPPEDDDCFCSWFERDQRGLRRLAQLLGRERVEKSVARRLAALRPGVEADEHTLAALVPLAHIQMPDPGLDFTADDWIDQADLPNDPVGRAQRTAARDDWRPRAEAAILRTGNAVLEKTLEMIPAATKLEFLTTVEQGSAALLDRHWLRDREVGFRSAILLRRAELSPSEEDRVVQEVARARFLLDNGRGAEADAAWTALGPRIGALPEGAPRMHAEADRAAFLERSKGKDAAAAEWARIGARYPWSLGILEDRVAFLARAGRGAEGRALLESAATRAAAGHREALLERLTSEALAAPDLPQARRAVGRLLAESALTDGQRLGAIRLLARLSLREDPRFDLLKTAKEQEPKLSADLVPDLYQTLAEAAEAEKSDPAAVTLWIEALNRRLERSWVRTATRAAIRAGQADAFRKFFETQQARSPRDVRWAVAVRELRLELGDLDGAIAMAKAAVAVRPEREGLWQDTADLLVRAGRPREAADFLEGWMKPRPADEDAAGKRSAFYARAGDADRALAVEQAAFSAFVKAEAKADTDAEESQSRIGERRSRAVHRLLQIGLPLKAWRMAGGAAGPRALAASGLSTWDAAELALASGNFLATLDQRWGDAEYRDAAASRLRDYGTPETKQEVMASLLRRLLPDGPPPARTPRASALAPALSFADASGIGSPLREAMARRILSLTPGPWQAAPTPTFIAALAEVIVQPGANGPEFRPPSLDALYVRDLVMRGRDEALWSFLEPKWTQTLALVNGAAPVAKDKPVPDWAVWLDDKSTLETWARGAAARPERIAPLAAVFSNRRSWDRLWAVAARGWSTGVLVAILPADAQAAWFRFWQKPSPTDADPILRARGEAVDQVSSGLARLVESRPAAAGDAPMERVHGPRTVGDVLGKDPKWLWPEFLTPAAPRPTVDPEERVFGTGPDVGRLPGALWGERPGAAWFVLETLARFRSHDADAALVPLEAPGRGGEAERFLLAVRLAEASGDDARALELDGALPGAAADARFRERLKILTRLGRADDARAALATETARQQGKLTEAGYRALWRQSEDLGLPDPLSALDPKQPVSPVFLAFLYDWKGPAAASRFEPTDPIDFRTALANRWSSRPRSLSADAVRFYLASLWANDAAPLPTAALPRLGPAWAESAAWLGRLRPPERAAGLAAVGALPDPARLEEMLAKDPEPEGEVVRLMRLRVALWKNDDEKARALFSRMLDEVVEGVNLAYVPAPVTTTPETVDEEGEGEAMAPESPTGGDLVTARLRAWMEPFRTRHRLDLVRARVLDTLRQRRERNRVDAAEWALALEVADEAALPALLDNLERGYVRGDLPEGELGPVVKALAPRAPGEAARFLARWPVRFTFDEVAERTRVHEAMKQPAAAVRGLAEARAAGLWTAAEEVKAFDAWRRFPPLPAEAGPDPSPAAWTAARPFWARRPGEIDAMLLAQLRANAFEVRAARAALRTAAPGEEAAMRAAASVLLEAPTGVVENAESDADFLGLRTARGLAKAAPKAALAALRNPDGETLAAELSRRRIPAAETAAALADVGRIQAAGEKRAGAESAMAALDARSPETGKALRRELLTAATPAPPPGYRMTASGPLPYRPRDLDWRLIAALLAAQDRP